MAASRFGRYEVVRSLASGGMADVVLARIDGEAGFSKQVALKRIHRHLADDESFIARFIDEARIAAELTHPNIVQVFDFGQVDGTYFIAMEYVHGRTVNQLLARASRRGEDLPLELVLGIVLAACEGLAFAHKLRDADGALRGVVHRDVSPQNLLISYDGVVKVADFGIARAAGRLHKTEAGATVGKLSYMAPEQLLGKPVDQRADVFALGVVFHELLTGQALFSTSQLIPEMRPRPAVPSSVNRALPPALDRIVLRALAQAPDERYESCDALYAELEEVVAAQQLRLSARRRAELMETWFPEASAPRPVPRLTPVREAPVVDEHPATVVGGPEGLAATDDHALDTLREGAPGLEATFDAPASVTTAPPDTLPQAAPPVMTARGVGPPLAPAPPRAAPRRERWSIGGIGALDPREAWPIVAKLGVLACVIGAIAIFWVMRHPRAPRADVPASAANGTTPAAAKAQPAAPTTPSGATAPAEVATPATPERAPTTPAESELAPPGRGGNARARGTLNLQVTPPVQVFRGAELLGRTPLHNVALPAGRQRLRLVAREHRLETVVEVEVKATGVTTRALTIGTGTLRVEAPVGLAVSIDGEPAGSTPLKAQPVYPGQHDVSVGSERHSVAIRAGQEKVLVIRGR